MRTDRAFLTYAGVCTLVAIPLLVISSVASAPGKAGAVKAPVRAIITGLSAAERLQIEEYARRPVLRDDLRLHPDYFRKLPRKMHDKLSSEFSRLVSVKAMSSIDGAIELKVSGIADKAATLVVTRIIGEALCKQVQRLRFADRDKEANALVVEENRLVVEMKRECRTLTTSALSGISMESAEQRVVGLLQAVDKLEREREKQKLVVKRAKGADVSSIVKGKAVPVAVALALGEMPANPKSDQEVQRLKATLEFKKAQASAGLAEIQSEIKTAQAQLKAARTARKEAGKRRHYAREAEVQIAALSARRSMLETKRMELRSKVRNAKPPLMILGTATTTKPSADKPASPDKGKE